MEKIIFENQWIIWLAILWTFPWKGVALWKSARNGHKVWFVVLLILNTLAILEILYIFVFSKKKEEYLKTESKDTPSQNGNNLIKGL
ncbi:MAG: DUF5652 family protein [Candidatus Moranbacteria bacterium]|nr:DUF5652 family protein [Candidatus Moranbacteria bacterium]